MSNKNQKAFEQMRRLTKEAKKFYAHNYNPESLYPPRDTKFFLNEEYIPFDFETDYDDPLYTEYRRVRMLKNPFEDTQIQTQNLAPKQNLKGFGLDDGNNKTNSANFSFSKSWPSSFAQSSDTVDYSKYGEGFSKEFIDEMLADKRFNNAMNKYVIPNEGGYVNHPNDKGGETNMGITKKFYPDEDIKNLTRERANAIYYRDYWKYNGINTLLDEIVGIVFDNAVIQGQGTAIQNVHKSLDIEPGTIIGPSTQKKLENTDYNVFINRFKDYAKSRVNKIIDSDDSQSIFKNGWNNRINKY